MSVFLKVDKPDKLQSAKEWNRRWTHTRKTTASQRSCLSQASSGSPSVVDSFLFYPKDAERVLSRAGAGDATQRSSSATTGPGNTSAGNQSTITPTTSVSSRTSSTCSVCEMRSKLLTTRTCPRSTSSRVSGGRQGHAGG